ncbi:hypothetical protein WN51_10466 [Melipona quadrifasciata]|uniref:Uncharacterized protein n=1 Tax=Melipona quadrifasciata TaxID=166423 RepID=A0A0N0BI57_9HYME|nr:hypothetical protein WN51_10466 [Melipona quadrifasciata]
MSCKFLCVLLYFTLVPFFSILIGKFYALVVDSFGVNKTLCFGDTTRREKFRRHQGDVRI